MSINTIFYIFSLCETPIVIRQKDVRIYVQFLHSFASIITYAILSDVYRPMRHLSTALQYIARHNNSTIEYNTLMASYAILRFKTRSPCFIIQNPMIKAQLYGLLTDCVGDDIRDHILSFIHQKHTVESNSVLASFINIPKIDQLVLLRRYDYDDINDFASMYYDVFGEAINRSELIKIKKNQNAVVTKKYKGLWSCLQTLHRFMNQSGFANILQHDVC